MQIIRYLPIIPALALSTPAYSAAVEPTVDKGDAGFIFICSVIVLMMSIPGLALFYGGMVRAKNMLSVLTQVFAIVCLAMVIWAVYGYSLAFTTGGLNSFIGGFDQILLKGVNQDSLAETFSEGVYIPEYIFIFFQGTFAAITAALIVGAFAERVKFSAVLLFTTLWLTFIYFPIAHMVWYSGGLMFEWGTFDFAGGTVVHINAGIAGLIGCLFLGKRIGFGQDAMAPHNLTFTMIGGSLLWVGWFGFNAGSNLEATGVAALAAVNTVFATAAAALVWMILEWTRHSQKPSLLGIVTGAIAGLVAITPACGFATPATSLLIGAVASIFCYWFCTTVKNKLGYDDTLDVFGVHCVAGIVGAILTGVVADPALGGQGGDGFNMASQVWIQTKAVLFTILWTGVGSAVLFALTNKIVGLRVTNEEEREGLDIASHGERAYTS